MHNLTATPSQPAGGKAVIHNIVFICLFNLVWALGNPMVNSSTIIASFFDKLGSRPIVFGLVQVSASLPVLIQFLPRLVRLRSGNLKHSMATMYMLTGVAYIVYGLVTLYSASNPALFVPVLLALYFLVFCLYQLAVILYLDYIMQLFPAEILGRFYGFNGLFASAGAIAGGAVAGSLLKSVGFPTNYGYMFMLAGGIFIVSTVLSLFTKQVGITLPEQVYPSVKAYAANVAIIFKRPAVRYFAFLIILIYVNLASYGFALIFLNRELGSNVDPAAATLISYVSQAVLLLVVGFSLDRLGRMKTVAGYMTLVLAANVVILLPIQHSYVFVFAAYGMYALFISMVKVRLANEVVPMENRLDTVIIVNVAGVVASSAVSLLYGILAEFVGSYRFIFVLSALSVVLLYFVAARLSVEIRKIAAKPDIGSMGAREVLK